ncbi:hypothetical protein GPECTOR_129g550 [Gonium pectorale]|uniref:Uncharacterized protein n=1 Tax=Gonium pectorale TaxID=33097 RepID=A0A150FYC6_GONPE|nr:hypothetical protein GPECTOR_129g550 [Gonium pectorale]|eukprot:KXZ42621.1 hypothetical protein GPECTOR_129g550 [Gonium pectorale]
MTDAEARFSGSMPIAVAIFGGLIGGLIGSSLILLYGLYLVASSISGHQEAVARVGKLAKALSAESIGQFGKEWGLALVGGRLAHLTPPSRRRDCEWRERLISGAVAASCEGPSNHALGGDLFPALRAAEECLLPHWVAQSKGAA